MAGLYRGEERERRAAAASAGLVLPDDGHAFRPAAVGALFALMIAFLVFANWAPAEVEDSAVWHALFAWKWPLSERWCCRRMASPFRPARSPPCSR